MLNKGFTIRLFIYEYILLYSVKMSTVLRSFYHFNLHKNKKGGIGCLILIMDVQLSKNL